MAVAGTEFDDCKIDYCDESAVQDGLCSDHLRDRDIRTALCAVDRCLAKVHKRRLCELHFKYMTVSTCRLGTCEAVAGMSGYCNQHFVFSVAEGRCRVPDCSTLLVGNKVTCRNHPIVFQNGRPIVHHLGDRNLNAKIKLPMCVFERCWMVANRNGVCDHHQVPVMERAREAKAALDVVEVSRRKRAFPGVDLSTFDRLKFRRGGCAVVGCALKAMSKQSLCRKHHIERRGCSTGGCSNEIMKCGLCRPCAEKRVEERVKEGKKMAIVNGWIRRLCSLDGCNKAARGAYCRGHTHLEEMQSE
jgi:hypothetical protein